MTNTELPVDPSDESECDGQSDNSEHENQPPPVPNPNPQEHTKGKFDLTERTARFGEAVIRFAKTLPVTPVTRNMITQLLDASTSVGANYNEADEGVSKKDFRNKIGICKKEARESKYWLRMMATAVPEKKAEDRPLWQEAKELHLIFSTIFRSSGS
jgi:four helix bundle protein